MTKPLDVSNELFSRLEQEAKDFEETIGMKFNIEDTIWELLKIAGSKEKDKDAKD